MSGTSRTTKEQAYFFAEQITHLVEARIARAYSELQKAFLSFSKLTPDEITAILLHHAQECLAGPAAPLIAFTCNRQQLEFFLQQLDLECRKIEGVLPGLTDLVLHISNQSVARAFASRFRRLIKAELEAWKAQGHRNVFEFNQYCEGIVLTPPAASRDQAELNALRQQAMEYFKCRIAVPPLSLNGASPALSLNGSSPGRLIEASARPVIEVIDADPSLRLQGSNGGENPAKLNAWGSTNRKRGRKRAVEKRKQMSRIMETIAPDGDCMLKLPEICRAFDSEQLSFPRNWAKNGHGSWSLCLREDPQLVEKNIRHHLSTAKKTLG